MTSAVLSPAPALPLGEHWPSSAKAAGADVEVGGVPLSDVAERFGTPVYVLDEKEVRARCRRYSSAFPGTDIVYAAKAYLDGSMLSWIADEGLGLDVCSPGELELALAAGFSPDCIILHGNAKSPANLASAVRHGVGRVVIDSLSEIGSLAEAASNSRPQQVLLRIVPGIAAGGHAKIRTGTDGQKFGLSATDGSAQWAIARILEHPSLRLVGLHCHLGSQITSAKPYLTAVRRMVGFLATLRDTRGLLLPQLDLGGGHGIAYQAGDPVLDIASLGPRLHAELVDSCAAANLPAPRLTIEPGRAIVGPAGIAVYRVLSIKHSGGHVWVAVDGGMSDNPRPALYGQQYAVRVIRQTARDQSAGTVLATVVGRHCESGDVIATDVLLPADLGAGDLMALPAAGAYHLSMASSYNLVGRPPVVAVKDGSAQLVVRRETFDDLHRRDLALRRE